MPQMGCRRFCRRFLLDEVVRGKSNSRRHSEAGIQNTPDQARDARVINVRSDAFRFGLVARAEAGLSSEAEIKSQTASLHFCSS